MLFRSNPVALINQLSANGVAAVVLFNRFYPIDINVDRMQQVPGKALSTEMDLGSAEMDWNRFRCCKKNGLRCLGRHSFSQRGYQNDIGRSHGGRNMQYYL